MRGLARNLFEDTIEVSASFTEKETTWVNPAGASLSKPPRENCTPGTLKTLHVFLVKSGLPALLELAA